MPCWPEIRLSRSTQFFFEEEIDFLRMFGSMVLLQVAIAERFQILSELHELTFRCLKWNGISSYSLRRNESGYLFGVDMESHLCELRSENIYFLIDFTLYWANPPQRWWRNASLWGVKVGVQNVPWWAVCLRKRLPLWGRVAVGAWMTLGAVHGLWFLVKLVSNDTLLKQTGVQTDKHHHQIYQHEHVRTEFKVSPMPTLYPKQHGNPWCWPGHHVIT